MSFRYIHPEQKKVIASMHDRGRTRQQLISSLPFSRATIDRVVKLYKTTGKVTRTPLQAGRPRTLTSIHLNYLEGLVERQPNIYLRELQHVLAEAHDLFVDISTIWRGLQRRGWTLKKPTIIPKEANEADRARYQATVGEDYPPEYLVFVDESAANRHTSRRPKAWAPLGDRARRHDFFIRGQRYSVLPAISLDGVLHLDVISKSWTGVEFRQYIDTLLNNMNPYPAPNSVLVMDNAVIHHFEGLQEMVEDCGMRLLYLPAYSPDLNPIEEGFSAMKAWLRANRDLWLMETGGGPETDPVAMLWTAVFTSMTPDNIQGWFIDSGYW